jgi:hypothetical protein
LKIIMRAVMPAAVARVKGDIAQKRQASAPNAPRLTGFGRFSRRNHIVPMQALTRGTDRATMRL